MKQADAGAVVVTGAGSGIGFAVTRLLLREGYVVAAWDTTPGRLGEIDGSRLVREHLDVRDRAAMDAAVGRILDRAPRIDGLVSCAAVFKAAPFLELDEATWDTTFAVNLKGTLFACQAVLPAMRRERRGSIVLFSSTIARTGAAKAAHYAATKGGILGLARSLALETAADNIRVNVVSPGITDTPQPRANFSQAYLDARAKDIPLGRIGQPEDMADTVLFLLGDESSFVTGQDIRVNGGHRLF
ncbi:MAG TPA: SDR family NAD(P)-dependent oxidoreductase [Xanthobacteraceae bacterium]|nr:SDR family NAD(P)-dependent oxidoreductase [Xanthobacteraceae bacterium]